MPCNGLKIKKITNDCAVYQTLVHDTKLLITAINWRMVFLAFVQNKHQAHVYASTCNLNASLSCETIKQCSVYTSKSDKLISTASEKEGSINRASETCVLCQSSSIYR
ncbi:hypothetical protein CDAR_15001 [Caerostris darwini]|uniref:Uncharacterized protein n=1 Tax=Caerostris darwini TaxID=1538125 RepID=A0AAV4P992_9ARAC|nr:hypothetical protein CDAR_15001 [Caerostris darwini]